MTKDHSILVVAIESERFETIAPMLRRRRFEVDRFPGARGALELLSVVPFRALVLGCPMQDIEFNLFLSQVRGAGSVNREVPIAVVVQPLHLEQARSKLGDGVELIISLDEPPVETEAELCEFLGIKARRRYRTMVNLTVVIENSRKERFAAQTKNISASGLFIAVSRHYPEGSRTSFEFVMPGESKPFCGEAEVVRNVQPAAGQTEGLALHFLSFIRNTPERLEECLIELSGVIRAKKP